MPHRPHPKQAAFLLLNGIREGLFGGAAGGGKSDALLMAALQFADVPGYSAILFRRQLSDLVLSDALIPRAHEWLAGTEAKWNGASHTWTFPSGATLAFGYLKHANDRYRYQSSAFQFIGFDELTQFEEHDYLYLFSRLRKPAGSPLPLRMRAATNPGGIGHHWVKARFVSGALPGRFFVPSRLADNPSLDGPAYIASLEEMPPVERERLLAGDWEIEPTGGVFEASWLDHRYDELPSLRTVILAVDTANKETMSANFTAIGAWGFDGRNAYLLDVCRARLGFPRLKEEISRMAIEHTPDRIYIEDAASGQSVIQDLKASSSLPVVAYSPQGSKQNRADAISGYFESGRIFLPRYAGWLGDYVSEMIGFPNGAHDDQVDMTTMALAVLFGRKARHIAVLEVQG